MKSEQFYFPLGNHLFETFDSTHEFTRISEMDAVTATEILIQQYINPVLPRIILRHAIEAFQNYATDMKGYAILNAHGSIGNNCEWLFGTREGSISPKTVQSWIDRHDGQRALIYLCCCNPANSKITSQKSLVIHFNAKCTSRAQLNVLKGDGIRFYVPGSGYMDHNPIGIRKLINGIWRTKAPQPA